MNSIWADTREESPVCPAPSRDEPIKQLRIDVAPGEDRDRDLALHIDLAREERGKGSRTAGLHHQLELAESKCNGRGHFLIADSGTGSHQFAVDGKSQLARRLRHQRVADGTS